MNDVSDTAALPADTPPAEVVRCYWQRMQGRDFRGVAPLLGPELTVDWPQSNERFRGPERFLQMNREYPAHGPWTVQLHRLVADGAQVVTQVTVGDGVQRAEPVSFFEVAAGRIRRIVEYWPEPFAPATDRRHLSEPIAEVGVDASAGAEPGAAADAAGAVDETAAPSPAIVAAAEPPIAPVPVPRSPAQPGPVPAATATAETLPASPAPLPRLLTVVTTVASHEDGRRLAQALVGRRLAACAQLEAIESVYVWDGRLEQAPECRVLFKTTGARAAALEAGIRALHGYVQPAIHAWPVVQADPGFAQWVEAAVAPPEDAPAAVPRLDAGG